MSGPWYPISILSWTSIVDIPSLVTVITFAIAVAMGTSIVHAATVIASTVIASTVIASTVIAWRFIICATIGFNNALVGVLVYWTTSTPTTSTKCAVGAGTDSALAIDARRRIGWPDVPRIIFIDYTSYIPHIPFIDQTVHFIDPIGT